jgi:hypothetical protein
MITGDDTVLLAGGRIDRAIRTMLDRLLDRWPDMLTAVDGVRDGVFQRWPMMRDLVPAGKGEVYVARDAAMERRWDEVGYSLMEHDEGPFALLYQPAARSTVELQLEEDPYDHPHGFQFEPYRATLVATGLSLITVVTPDAGNPFGRRLVEALEHALIEHAR